MYAEVILFWTLAGTGSVLAGWWLAARPRASLQGIGVPVASMVLTLSVLVCLLSLTGRSVHGLLREVRDIVLGG